MSNQAIFDLALVFISTFITIAVNPLPKTLKDKIPSDKYLSVWFNLSFIKFLYFGAIIYAASFFYSVLFWPLLLGSQFAKQQIMLFFLIKLLFFNGIFLLTKFIYEHVIISQDKELFLARYLSRGKASEMTYSNSEQLAEGEDMKQVIIKPMLMGIVYCVICFTILVLALIYGYFNGLTIR